MFNRNHFILSVFITLLLSLICASTGLADTLPVLETKPESIVIFKNGLGFFVREGEVSLSNGWAVTEEVPDATLGTFWVSSPEENSHIEEVIAFKEEVKTGQDAISMDELLEANTGKKVILYSGDDMIEGIIKSVPAGRTSEVIDIYSSSSYINNIQSTVVILTTQEGDVAINKGSITKIKFPEGCGTRFFTEGEAKKIKFKVATEQSSAPIRLAYLQKGITWTPGYLVDIEDPEKARITMNATVINDVEDLEDVEVFFVVGYPNFMFADILSPLTLNQTITQFIQALESGRTSGYDALSNIMAQSVTFNVPANEGGISDYGYTAAGGATGSSEEDLFLYNKPAITLKKGERACYTITSDTVPYKHIYEWKIPDTMEQNKEIEQVWHSLKLDNTTTYPWTTAPAFVVNGLKPVAQDIINYTPMGTDMNLKLTIATDIKTDRKEYETDRQRDVKIYNYSHYDLVTVQGELYIKNSKNKDIILEIEKKLTGEVMETSHNGEVTKVLEGLTGVNYNSVIKWEVPVKSGEKVQVTYKYNVYISQ